MSLPCQVISSRAVCVCVSLSLQLEETCPQGSSFVCACVSTAQKCSSSAPESIVCVCVCERNVLVFVSISFVHVLPYPLPHCLSVKPDPSYRLPVRKQQSAPSFPPGGSLLPHPPSPPPSHMDAPSRAPSPVSPNSPQSGPAASGVTRPGTCRGGGVT